MTGPVRALLAAAPSPIGGDEARRLAEQELSRPEYRQGGDSWLQRVLHLFDRLLSGLSGGGGSGLVLGVVGVVILAVVVLAAVRAGKPPGRRARADDAAADPLGTTPGVDHAAVAGRLAAAGDLRAAVREYLRATVAALEDRGLLTPRPGRTGAAAAAEGGRADPAARDALAAGARAFDETWFGDRAASPADVDAARRALDAVRAGAGSGRR